MTTVTQTASTNIKNFALDNFLKVENNLIQSLFQVFLSEVSLKALVRCLREHLLFYDSSVHTVAKCACVSDGE